MDVLNLVSGCPEHWTIQP